MGANVYPPPGAIKSIQSGFISITNSNTSNAATVTQVNTSKSVLMLLGAGGASASAGDLAAYLSLTNSTTVTAFRGSTSGTCTVSWQLVEYY